jgi:hypothetical protein
MCVLVRQLPQHQVTRKGLVGRQTIPVSELLSSITFIPLEITTFFRQYTRSL